MLRSRRQDSDISSSPLHQANAGRYSLSARKIIAVVPIPICLALLIALAGADPGWVFDSPILLLALNSIFLSILPLTVVYIAARGYLLSGSVSLILLGSGALSWGAGSFLAALMLAVEGDPNDVVALHNCGALVSSLFHFLGAGAALAGIRPQLDPRRRKWNLFVAYSCVSTAFGALGAGALTNVLPVFFVQGVGPTLVRQLVLGFATAIFFCSGVLFLTLNLRSNTSFMFWYSMALHLVSVGLLCIFFQKSVGSAIGWTGRGAQYLAGIYLCAAVLSASRELRGRGQSLDGMIANLFKGRLATLVEERTAELAKANVLLRSVLSSLDEAVLLVDPATITITHCNAAAARIFGYTGHELLGQQTRLLHVSQEAFLKFGQDAIASCRTQGYYSAQYRMKRKNGEIFPSEHYVAAIRDDAGNILNLVSVVRDVTERKKWEDTIRRAEQRLRLVLDTVPALIWQKDPDGKYLQANNAYCATVGLSEGEILGKTDYDIFPQEIADKYVSDDRKVLDAGLPLRGVEEPHRKPTGEDGWSRTDKMAFFDDYGNIAGTIGFALDITERKKAAENLVAVQQKLKEVNRLAKVGVWEWIVASDTVFWSEELCNILKYDPMAPAPSYHGELEKFYSPASWEILRGAVERTLNTGKQYDLELEMITTDGERLWTQTIGGLKRSETGELIGLLGLVRDITDRKRAEEALASSERYLVEAQRIAHVGSWNIDIDSNSLYWSDEVYRIFGLEPQSITPTYESFLSFVHLDDRNFVETAYRKAVEAKTEYDVVHRVLRPDGAVRFVRERSQEIADENGKIVRSIGTVHDITDIKLAEDKLREQKEFLDTVIESLAHPFYIINANDYTIDRANSAAVSAEVAANSTCYAATHNRTTPCEGDDHLCPLELVRKTGLPAMVEHVHTDHKGQARNVEVHCFPLRDASGAVQRVIEYTLDITDRKKAQDALVQSERFRAVVDLTAGVAHNFNNLLQIIIGGASLGLMNVQSGDFTELKENLDEIMQSSRFGAETVRRLSRYARGHEIDPTATIEFFDLSDLVKQAAEMTRSWWKTEPEKRGVRIALHALVKNGCTIRGNKNEMFEVLVNLIKNAVEALPTGGNIEIVCEIDQGRVELSVKDDGVGIPKDNLPRLFTPFFTSSVEAGRGLGLATCRRIVDSHGGTILPDSIEGRGTTFTITLPYAREVPVQQDAGEGKAAEAAWTVLAVDDMEATVKTLKAGLTKRGHTVLTAQSGEEALAIFKENRIDLVICDLGMPGMTGWEVAENVKSASDKVGRPKTPFIVLTGWEDEVRHEETAARSGVDAVIKKPVDITKLLEIMRVTVKSRGGRSGDRLSNPA